MLFINGKPLSLRNMSKFNHPNDGTRSLFGSVLVVEVIEAIRDWRDATSSAGVLIGAVALCYYVKLRQTSDADFLFPLAEDIPAEVPGFKRASATTFVHQKTLIQIDVLVASAIGLTSELADAIVSAAIEVDGFKVGSREGLIAMKLGRFKLRDQADIAGLLQLGPVDLRPFPLDERQRRNFETVVIAAEKENVRE